MEIRFAILPPPRINKLTARLARASADFGKNCFAVDNQQLFPHITLFVIDVPKNKLVPLVRELKILVSKKQAPLRLRISGYKSFYGVWFSLKIEKTRQLNNLRVFLVRLTKHYQVQPKHRFQPHITMTKYKKHGQVSGVGRKMEKVKTSFMADTIGLCLSDKFSQVYKVLYKINLQK